MDAIDIIIDYRRKKHVCKCRASGMSTKHNGRLLSASENIRTGFEHRILNKLVSPWPLFIKIYYRRIICIRPKVFTLSRQAYTARIIQWPRAVDFITSPVRSLVYNII